MFWKLAKSSNEVDYAKYVKEIKELDLTAWKFLEKKDPKHFCRFFFKATVKCDSIDNNMAKMFNGSTVEARFKPIITMLEDIFEFIMTRVASRRLWLKVHSRIYGLQFLKSWRRLRINLDGGKQVEQVMVCIRSSMELMALLLICILTLALVGHGS